MLKAAGVEPYQHLNVHGYWNVNQGKMSKSIGNVVKPLDLADVYGLDVFRYFLVRDMVFGLDSEFSEEALIGRINADLANGLGNLVSRSLTMVQNFYGGELPPAGQPQALEDGLKREAFQLLDAYEAFMGDLSLHKALAAVWEFIGSVNKYIVTTEPWVLAKSDRLRLATVMSSIVEALKVISALIWPVMPESARSPQEGLMSKLLIQRTFLVGLIISLGVIGNYILALRSGDSLEQARTVAVTTMVFFQFFQAWNARTETKSIFRISPMSNPFLFYGMLASIFAHLTVIYVPAFQWIFRTVPLAMIEWGEILLASVTIIVAVEIDKWIRRKKLDAQ